MILRAWRDVRPVSNYENQHWFTPAPPFFSRLQSFDYYWSFLALRRRQRRFVAKGEIEGLAGKICRDMGTILITGATVAIFREPEAKSSNDWNKGRRRLFFPKAPARSGKTAYVFNSSFRIRCAQKDLVRLLRFNHLTQCRSTRRKSDAVSCGDEKPSANIFVSFQAR